jgi:hypothetical protein
MPNQRDTFFLVRNKGKYHRPAVAGTVKRPAGTIGTIKLSDIFFQTQGNNVDDPEVLLTPPQGNNDVDDPEALLAPPQGNNDIDDPEVLLTPPKKSNS